MSSKPMNDKNLLLTLETVQTTVNALLPQVQQEFQRIGDVADSEDDEHPDETLPERQEAYGTVLESLREAAPALDEAVEVLKGFVKTSTT